MAEGEPVVVEFDMNGGGKRYSMGADLDSALADYHHCGSPVCWRDVEEWREIPLEAAAEIMGEKYQKARECIQKPNGQRVYFMGGPESK